MTTPSERDRELTREFLKMTNTDKPAPDLREALEKIQFGWNGRCPACAGWDMGPYGETDGVHTKECYVAAALAASPAPKPDAGWVIKHGDPAEIVRLTAEINEWQQAAEVEAGLRREFLARAEAAEADMREVMRINDILVVQRDAAYASARDAGGGK